MPPRAPRTDVEREHSCVELVERFFAGTERSYDAMVHWATLGFDGRWKQRMLTHIPDGDGPVLDLACGTGISTLAIAQRFPNRLVIGVELRNEYLQIAREKVVRGAIPNVRFELARAEEFESSLRFDCVTSSYLAKYADLLTLTARSRAMLRHGGLLMMHDFTFPPTRSLIALWRLYFLVMRNSVARVFPEWSEIYRGLPKLIEETRWLVELQQALARSRFRNVTVEHLTLYGSAIVTAVNE